MYPRAINGFEQQAQDQDAYIQKFASEKAEQIGLFVKFEEVIVDVRSCKRASPNMSAPPRSRLWLIDFVQMLLLGIEILENLYPFQTS